MENIFFGLIFLGLSILGGAVIIGGGLKDVAEATKESKKKESSIQQ